MGGNNKGQPPIDESQGFSPVEGGGVQRTEIHCHHCSKVFVAELDYDVDGNHVIECPHCGHEHCRTIKQGKITDARWDGRNDASTVKVSNRSVWKSSVIKAQTSTTSEYIRSLWLNRSDIDG